MFELLQIDRGTKARRGRLHTLHGEIETPAFMPVGTQATVKTVSPRELRELKAQVILANTYHLYVRPGLDVIRHFGGLHRFMNWNGPILTDSGGYQIFSLAKLRKVKPEGVHFQNHVDGTQTFISPEIAMDIQAVLGSDIAMVLDECPPYPCDYDYAARSLDLTIGWSRRCKEASAINRSISAGKDAGKDDRFQLVFGIVQGATFPQLRQRGAHELVACGFDGYAIGGVSVGEPEPEMFSAVESTVPHLPPDRPRYVMGLGTPPQLVELIARGVDVFDCVLPTRLARNGTAFSSTGTLNLKNAEFIFDGRPIEEDCACPACREFTRGYIRHLIKAEEILGLRLISLHNLHFYIDLMERARTAISSGEFDSFRTRFVAGYAAYRHHSA